MASDMRHLTLPEMEKLARKRYKYLRRAANRGKKAQAKKAALSFNTIRALGAERMQEEAFNVFPDNLETPL